MLTHRLVASAAALLLAIPAYCGEPAAPQPETPVPAQQNPSQQNEKVCRAFSLIHHANEAAIKLADQAEKLGESKLVKAYALKLSTERAKQDLKLLAVAKKRGIEIKELDPQTPEGKSLLDRAKAEADMMSSLEGDAWDKEFLKLVTGCQDRMIKFINSKSESARSPEAKEAFTDLATIVENHNTVAKAIQDKIGADEP